MPLSPPPPPPLQPGSCSASVSLCPQPGENTFPGLKTLCFGSTFRGAADRRQMKFMTLPSVNQETESCGTKAAALPSPAGFELRGSLLAGVSPPTSSSEHPPQQHLPAAAGARGGRQHHRSWQLVTLVAESEPRGPASSIPIHPFIYPSTHPPIPPCLPRDRHALLALPGEVGMRVPDVTPGPHGLSLHPQWAP